MKTKTVVYGVNMNSAVSNIIDVTMIHGTDSRFWYRTEHNNLSRLAEVYSLPIDAMCGIFAALSPQMSWAANVACGLNFLQIAPVLTPYTIRQFTTSSRKALGVTQSGDNIIKALRIFQGEKSLDVLGGNKVRSFYQNLLSPEQNSVVTIDRHAISIAMHGIDAKVSGDITADPEFYWQWEKAYLIAGDCLGMLGHEIQAATWTYVASGKLPDWDFTR